MTQEQLNAIPYFSKVSWSNLKMTLLKVLPGGAILYHESSGGKYYNIAPEDITLAEVFTGITTTPTDIVTAPLYCAVEVAGKSGILIEKFVTPNPYTGVDYISAAVWYDDTELIEWVDSALITFIENTIPIINPDIIPKPTGGMSTKTLLIIGGIGVAIWYLTKGKNVSA